MDLGLAERVAIVTGASRGIGLAVARRLLEEGATVAICGRDAGRLQDAADALQKSKGHVIVCRADTANPADRDSFVETVLRETGRIDILVNNAGTHVRASVEDMTDDQLRRQMDDKVFGFFGMIRCVLPGMRHRRDGRIVNIIGQATRHPHPDRLPSGITNAAAQAMTKAVADAVARDNVRVNSVCPQYIETDIISNVIGREMRERGVSRETAAAGFTRANVLGRLGQPEEVADLVAFLVSDQANYVCGSSVSIDGGYHRYVFG